MSRLKLESVTRRAQKTLRPVQDVAEQSVQRALLHALGALDAATRGAAQARRTIEALLLRDRPGVHHALALQAAKLGRDEPARTSTGPRAPKGGAPTPRPRQQAVPGRKTAPATVSARSIRAAPDLTEASAHPPRTTQGRRPPTGKRGQKRR